MDGVFMKIRVISWILCVFAAAYALFGLDSLLLQKDIAKKTIRLHVVANSDSDEDQAQKLEVRDAVLGEVETLTKNCTCAEEAKQVLNKNLDIIRGAAQRVSPYEISVSLKEEKFDTRKYDTFTLPAGIYPSLRVQIGEARGYNWWCVVFPSLCTAATCSGVEEYAQAGGFDEAETRLITGGEETYTCRFRTLEWIQAFLDLFS